MKPDITTEEYFNNNVFSIDAFNKKYAMFEGETYVQALQRVCQAIASVEDDPKKQLYWSERWFNEIYDDWWHPAGSIMQGAGSKKGISLCNCTYVSLGDNSDKEWDNLESIIKNGAYTVAKCAAYRQGLGIDFSRIRPKNFKINNSSNESLGSIHWMKFIDGLGYYVGQLGRVPAFLISLSCSHPDIEDFIKIKSDYTQIQNANISVQCSDDFYKAVMNNQKWQLKFEICEIKKGQKVYIDEHSTDMDCKYDDAVKSWYYVAKHDRPYEFFSKEIEAKDLLKQIAVNMFKNGEPGIQNIDVARRYSNSDYVGEKIGGSNACSEQYLSRESLCVLSSINCGKFSKDYDDELKKIAVSINRFLDNVNEYELRHHKYATPHQKKAIESLRRTGAGITNIGAWLFKNDLIYGSKDGNHAIAEFVKQYNFYLYESSIELGKEKGSFKLFNQKLLEKSPFIQHMMKLGLKFTHLRNVTCSSIAPTGSLSLMFRDYIMSYGIEPAFGLYYWKRTRISGQYQYYFCVPNMVRKVFLDKGFPIPIDSDTIKDEWDGSKGKIIAAYIDENLKKLNINFKSSFDVSAMDKLDLMSQVMKNIDSSISVTYILSEKSSWKDVYQLILEAWHRGVKSIAAFPDKKMYGIVSSIPFRELATNLIKDGIVIHKQNFTKSELQELNLDSNEGSILRNNAPKRPKSLIAECYRYNKHIVVVGLLNGSPYEVMSVPDLNIKINDKSSYRVVKVSRGHYKLLIDDNIIIDDITKKNNDNEEALCRMISTNLRHGTNLEYIVHQLEKTKGDLTNIAKSIARTLKKFVKNGTKVSGFTCPGCQSNDTERQEGCITCINCGWSKCL